MSVDNIVKACIQDVPKAVAAGVVDMASGMLLGVKTIDSHPQEVLDLVAAATRELFEGENSTMIENLFKRSRGVTTDEHYFKEFIATSTNLIHIFGRLRSDPAMVVVVVTRADANLGLALTKARSIFATGTV